MKAVLVVFVLLGLTVAMSRSAEICTASITVNRGEFWACLDTADQCITAYIEYPGITINPSITLCHQENTDGSTCYRITSDNICSDFPMTTRLTLPKPDLSDTMFIFVGFRSNPAKVCFQRPQGECSTVVPPEPEDDQNNGEAPETETLQMKPEDRKAIQSQHNKLRRNTQPTPANMKKMRYNSNLENFAQNYLNGVSGCPLQHNPNNHQYGENVYIRNAWGTNIEKVDLKSVVTMWYDEIAYYNFNTRQCNPPPGESCGHYTQVVWDDTTKVGCGIKECVSGSITKTLVLCNYDPPGNVIPYGDSTPRKPYIQGTACSRCPSSHSNCTNKLCDSQSELELEALAELMTIIRAYEPPLNKAVNPNKGVQEWEMGQEDTLTAGFEEYAMSNEEIDDKGGLEFKVSVDEAESERQTDSGWETFVI